MTEAQGNQISLDQPVMYQIKVPGEIDVSHSDWAEDMALSVEGEEAGRPTTTLTGELDQAALHGLLRRLYALGLPIISVQWVGAVRLQRTGLMEE